MGIGGGVAIVVVVTGASVVVVVGVKVAVVDTVEVVVKGATVVVVASSIALVPVLHAAATRAKVVTTQTVRRLRIEGSLLYRGLTKPFEFTRPGRA